MENRKFSDLTIWLTGASRGIGLAIARKLYGTEAKLILSASNKDSFNPIIKELNEFKNVFLMPFDLTSADAVSSAFKKICSSFGRVNVLINNAGAAKFKSFINTTTEDFDNMLGVNLRGAFLCTKAVLENMMNRGDGIILNINSNAAIRDFQDCSIYSATKAALWKMSKILREEVRGSGIKVIDIFPGAVLTEVWDDDSIEKYRNRMILPEEAAEIVYNTIFASLNGRYMLEEIVVRPQTGDL